MVHFETHFIDQYDSQNERSHGLSTVEAVATTAVVCVVSSFIVGLLLASYLTRCRQVRKINQAKNNDTEDQPAPSSGENIRSEIYSSTDDKSSSTDGDSVINGGVSNKDLSSAKLDLSNNDE